MHRFFFSLSLALTTEIYLRDFGQFETFHRASDALKKNIISACFCFPSLVQFEYRHSIVRFNLPMKICVALYCFSLFARLFARVESKINFTRLVTHCQTQIQQQKTRSDSVYCIVYTYSTVQYRGKKNCLARLCYNSYVYKQNSCCHRCASNVSKP